MVYNVAAEGLRLSAKILICRERITGEFESVSSRTIVTSLLVAVKPTQHHFSVATGLCSLT